jgi:hypothetical protein
MKPAEPMTLVSNLIFCNCDVDPDVVTKAIGLEPTFVQRIEEPLQYSNGYVASSSHIGTSRLELPNFVSGASVEEQIEQWVAILKPKANALRQLRAMGYGPYLNCPYRQAHLSVCLEPELLQALGELGVSLSIWLSYDENTSSAKAHPST